MVKETGGSVVKAADLVEYQSGLINSRTLLKREAGAVTFFAFDQGQEMSEHVTPHDALILLLEGEAEISVEGSGNVLRAGDAILMPANIPHELRALSSFKMAQIMIRE